MPAKQRARERYPAEKRYDALPSRARTDTPGIVQFSWALLRKAVAETDFSPVGRFLWALFKALGETDFGPGA